MTSAQCLATKGEVTLSEVNLFFMPPRCGAPIRGVTLFLTEPKDLATPSPKCFPARRPPILPVAWSVASRLEGRRLRLRLRRAGKHAGEEEDQDEHEHEHEHEEEEEGEEDGGGGERLGRRGVSKSWKRSRCRAAFPFHE